jgi:type II secretory pathway pseudopilin PulG
MKRSYGFTIAELVVVIVFFAFASILLIYQKANIEASQRDEKRKTAINAMYYNLEEVFFKKNGYYPETISSDNLTAMDPDLFTDPLGYELGSPQSSYRYEAVNCENEKCGSYTLRAQLEKEADYIKTNREK